MMMTMKSQLTSLLILVQMAVQNENVDLGAWVGVASAAVDYANASDALYAGLQSDKCHLLLLLRQMHLVIVHLMRLSQVSLRWAHFLHFLITFTEQLIIIMGSDQFWGGGHLGLMKWERWGCGLSVDVRRTIPAERPATVTFAILSLARCSRGRIGRDDLGWRERAERDRMSHSTEQRTNVRGRAAQNRAHTHTHTPPPPPPREQRAEREREREREKVWRNKE